MSTGPDHTARAHSELGASICDRWWNCPGSVRVSRGLPNSTSIHAQRGTAAHEVAELCLANGQDAIEYVGRVVNGIEIDDRTADKVQSYLDDCRAYDGPPEFAWNEVRFDLAPLDPPAPMFGTADRVEYSPADRLLRVRDYKNGWHKVDPQTPQLKYYALGAVVKLGAEYPVSRVIVTIHQPEHGKPRSHEYDAVELAQWSVELMDRARATQEPDSPLDAGPWCRFCPAAGTCPENARAALETAQMEFADVSVPAVVPPDAGALTEDEIGCILDRAEQFEAWIDSVRAYAKQQAEILGQFAGRKVVTTEGREAWRSEDDAAATLESLHEVEPWAPRKVISPAKARTALADKYLTAAVAAYEAAGKPKGQKPTKKSAAALARQELAALSHRPNTGLALVPVADARLALPAAGSEFTALPAEQEDTA